MQDAQTEKGALANRFQMPHLEMYVMYTQVSYPSPTCTDKMAEQTCP